jgi:hypothetical protein
VELVVVDHNAEQELPVEVVQEVIVHLVMGQVLYKQLLFVEH